MPHYEVTLQAIRVGEADFFIRSLKDRQQFDDPDGAHARAGISPATWPFFGVVWPSSMILADRISRYRLEGSRILEIGCGLGLASLVAHSRGANVIASDYHPLAETFLNENIALNRLPPLRFERRDWSMTGSDLGTFDLIMGSDVLYEPDHPRLVSSFIDRHSSDGTRVIIVDPGRKWDGKFTRLMSNRGYVATIQRDRGELAKCLGFKGKILTYARSAKGTSPIFPAC